MNNRHQKPFTAEEFHSFIGEYTRHFWSVQILAILAGLAIVLLLLSRVSWKSRVIALLTAALWLWNGIVFFLSYFHAMEPMAALFGWSFIFQGIYLLFHGGVLGNMDFQWKNLKTDGLSIGIISIALLIYPLTGLWTGQGWPALPLFGIIPCPTVLFTLGLLLSNKKRMPRCMLLVPFLWSLLAINAALNFGVLQDLFLAPSALAAAIGVSLNNKRALKRIIETEEGIQDELTVEEYDAMQRGFRDKKILNDREIINCGISKGKVLELGPGPGYLGLEWLKGTEETRLTGLEISPEMINKAKKNSQSYGFTQRTEYIQGNVMQIPLEENSLEGAFSNGSLHEWEDPGKVLKELFRVLKPGSHLFISDLRRDMAPCIIGIMQLLTPTKQMKAGLITSIQAAYRKEELQRLMEESPFQDFSLSQSPFGLSLTARKEELKY